MEGGGAGDGCLEGLPQLLLEVGFLCSVEREDAALSLFVGDLSIYYDASAPYAFLRTSWVSLFRHLKVISACELIF